MEQKSSKVIRSKSEINYSYATIRVTQSRIDKGLLAIPIALAEWFPTHNETIQVYLNDSPDSQTKHYSSYTSATHECRIGGLRQWFQQNNIKSEDEIVVQFTDKNNFIYRLIPERSFVLATREFQHNFDNSATEQEASERITSLAQWTHLGNSEVMLNEYYRLINASAARERRYAAKSSSRAREGVRANLRVLLEHIYNGHCQVCDFWFLRRDARPYFEIHHLDPVKGHHPQNLLVVCGNCHNQFEHADVQQEFNETCWLVRVSFNQTIHPVKQAVLGPKVEVFFKELFI